MPVEIRRASAADIPQVQQFYRARGYRGGIAGGDTVLLAETSGQLIGAVRLAPEQGSIVLRGMQVHPDHQRQGVGSTLLARISDELGESACYCILYAHLVQFYAQIGFEVIEPTEAPQFLNERLASYRARGDGREYLLMHRRHRAA
jgi:N-acetylglutamate synthase-like GNAT family acetyltransferase